MDRYRQYQKKKRKKAKPKPENTKALNRIKRHFSSLGMDSLEEYLKWCKEQNFRRCIDKKEKELKKEWHQWRSKRAESVLRKHRVVKNIPREIIRLSALEEKPKEAGSYYLNELYDLIFLFGGSMQCLPNQFLYHVSKQSDLLNRVDFIHLLPDLWNYNHKWIRDFRSWKPDSHNLDKQFSSLVKHLFVKYPIPEFMVGGFLSGNKTTQEFLIHLGIGESVRTFKIPKIKLTKKEAHYFRLAPHDSYLDSAIVWAQTRAMGGSHELAMAARDCTSFMIRKERTFWKTVIKFFIDRPELKAAQLRPVIDYILAIKFNGEEIYDPERGFETLPPLKPNFSMKGRKAKPLMDSIEKWQKELREKSEIAHLSWQKSGLRKSQYTDGSKKHGNQRLWTFSELLSGKELTAEGKAQKHCVASYSSECQRGRASIWSLRCNRRPTLTIEVRPAIKTIVQVKGKCNRSPKKEELKIIRQWAYLNRLSISKYA